MNIISSILTKWIWGFKCKIFNRSTIWHLSIMGFDYSILAFSVNKFFRSWLFHRIDFFILILNTLIIKCFHIKSIREWITARVMISPLDNIGQTLSPYVESLEGPHQHWQRAHVPKLFSPKYCRNVHLSCRYRYRSWFGSKSTLPVISIDLILVRSRWDCNKIKRYLLIGDSWMRFDELKLYGLQFFSLTESISNQSNIMFNTNLAILFSLPGDWLLHIKFIIPSQITYLKLVWINISNLGSFQNLIQYLILVLKMDS